MQGGMSAVVSQGTGPLLPRALRKMMPLCSNQLHGLAGVAHARRHSVDGQQQRVAQLRVVGLAAQPTQNLHLLGRVGGGREGSFQRGADLQTSQQQRGKRRRYAQLPLQGSKV